jgi:ABC-2 type transport system permease protein
MSVILRVILNEVYKSLLHLWSYRYNTLAQIIQRGIGFLGISFVLGQGQLNISQMAFVLPGWIMSFYARVILFHVDESITHEAQAGTLEQMYMSPASSGWLLLGRVVAVLSVATIQAAVLATGLMLITGVRLPLSWSVVPVVLLVLAGLFGFNFLLAGLALVLKSVRSIIDLSQDLLLLVNGTLVAVTLLPLWLQTLSLAMPTTYGIIVLRRVLIEQRSLPVLWQDGSLLILAAHSAAYVLVGWLVYSWCEQIAKRQGTLGQY